MSDSREDYTFSFAYVDGSEVAALALTLPIACILIVLLRFFTRSTSRNGFGIDDWLVALGLVFVVGCGICLAIGAFDKVIGYPTPPMPKDLTEEEAVLYTDPTTMYLEKLEYPFQILIILAYGSIKMGIVFFYRRVFVTHKRSWFDYITLATVLVLLVWTIAFVLIIIFPCGLHVWANWGSTAAQLKYCPIAFTSEYGIAISDLILDLFVILMPLPLVWQLHLTTQRKIAVTGILLLGASAIGASVVRLVLYVQILNAVTAGLVYDINQALTVSLYWSMLEAGLALIAACLPTLSYLFTKFSLKSAVDSFRSMISLASMRSDTVPTPHPAQSSNRDSAPIGIQVIRSTREDAKAASEGSESV